MKLPPLPTCNYGRDTFWLDRAAHSVASIPALAEWWLATVAGNQAIRRVRAGQLGAVDPFDCIPEA
jgi:hypothetical protein